MPVSPAKTLGVAAALSAGALLTAVPHADTHASVLPITAAQANVAAADGRRASRKNRVQRRSGERVTRKTRTETGWQRQTTVTGERGQQATRNTEVHVDRENRSYDRSTVATGPRGKEVTTEASGRYDPDSGFSRNKVKTLPDGRTATVDSTASYDRETQTYSKTVTRTGPEGNGETRTITRQRAEAEAGE